MTRSYDSANVELCVINIGVYISVSFIQITLMSLAWAEHLFL